MSSKLLVWLGYLNLLSLLVPIGIGLSRWPRLTTSLRFAWAGLLSYFGLFSLFVISTFGYVTIRGPLLRYAMPGLFGAAFAACYALAVPAGRGRSLIVGLGIIGLIGLVAEATGGLAMLTATPLAIPVQTIINTLIPLIYLRYLTQTTTLSLLTVPLFWISIGRLISSLTSTLYDALRGPMIESSRELLMNWLFLQLCITIACNLVYGVGFWKTPRT